MAVNDTRSVTSGCTRWRNTRSEIVPAPTIPSLTLFIFSYFRFTAILRTRNVHPVGHTRLPRYVRAKLGTIERGHGVFVFPDTNAHSLGENPPHLYSVRFAMRELWGDRGFARSRRCNCAW